MAKVYYWKPEQVFKFRLYFSSAFPVKQNLRFNFSRGLLQQMPCPFGFTFNNRSKQGVADWREIEDARIEAECMIYDREHSS